MGPVHNTSCSRTTCSWLSRRRRLATLWASTAYYRDGFTFYLLLRKDVTIRDPAAQSLPRRHASSDPANHWSLATDSEQKT
jgi:hypothetical protein